jgi:Uma2 family endonuclease
MATTTRRLTFEDLELIPEEQEGDRHELIDGELVVTPVPVMKHQIVSMNLIRHLDRHIVTGELGMVFHPPTGIRFTPDNLLVPDICFVAQDRLHVIGPKTIDAAPDLVVEILSPGTRRRDLETKQALYARFGVQEYWVVDPDAETVTVLALVGDRYEPVPPGDHGVIASRVLPEFTLAVNDVFAGVER